MAENSKIEWTDHTFNPWVGCTKLASPSPAGSACDHCYAESWAKRSGAPELWTGSRRRTTPTNWRGPLKWDKDAAAAGVRRRVFCASLADVFDNQVPTAWRDDLWRLIAATPHLDWLLLTKRPQNITAMLPDSWVAIMGHVWLGTTVENQRETRRIDALRKVPAAVRFLSCEPLLGWIVPDLTGVDWVICGGESGPKARDMDPSWARNLLADCRAEDVAFFMKQMARKAPIPTDLMVREFPTLF